MGKVQKLYSGKTSTGWQNLDYAKLEIPCCLYTTGTRDIV